MFAILFRFHAKPGRLPQLIDFLKRDGEFAQRHERGTLRFEFYKDPKDDNAIYVYEAYRDQKAFEVHKQHEPFQEWSSGLKDELGEEQCVFSDDSVWSMDD